MTRWMRRHQNSKSTQEVQDFAARAVRQPRTLQRTHPLKIFVRQLPHYTDTSPHCSCVCVSALAECLSRGAKLRQLVDGVKDKTARLVGEAHGQQLTALHALVGRARSGAGQQRHAAHKTMVSEVKAGFGPLLSMKTSQSSCALHTNS